MSTRYFRPAFHTLTQAHATENESSGSYLTKRFNEEGRNKILNIGDAVCNVIFVARFQDHI